MHTFTSVVPSFQRILNGLSELAFQLSQTVLQTPPNETHSSDNFVTSCLQRHHHKVKMETSTHQAVSFAQSGWLLFTLQPCVWSNVLIKETYQYQALNKGSIGVSLVNRNTGLDERKRNLLQMKSFSSTER